MQGSTVTVSVHTGNIQGVIWWTFFFKLPHASSDGNVFIKIEGDFKSNHNRIKTKSTKSTVCFPWVQCLQLLLCCCHLSPES